MRDFEPVNSNNTREAKNMTADEIFFLVWVATWLPAGIIYFIAEMR